VERATSPTLTGHHPPSSGSVERRNTPGAQPDRFAAVAANPNLSHL